MDFREKYISEKEAAVNPDPKKIILSNDAMLSLAHRLRAAGFTVSVEDTLPTPASV